MSALADGTTKARIALEISMVEVHGTGTSLGDPIEACHFWSQLLYHTSRLKAPCHLGSEEVFGPKVPQERSPGGSTQSNAWQGPGRN
eukprot:5252103-Amphidinium_carterae.1